MSVNYTLLQPKEVYGNGAMNYITNRKLRLLRTYESHYELPKRHNHLVSAKYGAAKFSHLNFALHVAYMPSRRLRRLDTPFRRLAQQPDSTS